MFEACNYEPLYPGSSSSHLRNASNRTHSYAVNDIAARVKGGSISCYALRDMCVAINQILIVIYIHTNTCAIVLIYLNILKCSVQHVVSCPLCNSGYKTTKAQKEVFL